MKKLGFFKLKFRIIYPLTLFILVLSAGFYYFYTSRFEALAINSLKEKSDFVSQYFVDKLGENSSTEKNKKFDENIINKYNVEYFVLINNKGLVEKAYSLETAEKNYYTFTEEDQWTKNKKIFRTEIPLVINNSDLVKAYVGLSAGDYNRYIYANRQETEIISFIIFICCSFIIYILSSLAAMPILKITIGSDQFIKGNLKHKITYVKNSQLGVIAKALNYLSFNWDSANKKIESLDRQLKVIFRDKIGELNLEINQRRHGRAFFKAE